MATDLTSTDANVPVSTAHPSPPTPKSSAPHRWRFMFIYGTLAVVLGIAVAGVVIYAGRSINPAPKWSAWKPSGGGLGAAKQIAEVLPFELEDLAADERAAGDRRLAGRDGAR